MKQKLSKTLAVILSVIMALTSLSVTAFAYDGANSYEWNFADALYTLYEDAGASSRYAYQGSSTWLFVDADDEYSAVYVDATSGKLGSNSTSYAQINTGTILYLPAQSGTTITIDTYSNEIYAIGTGTWTITGDGSYVVRPDDLIAGSTFADDASSNVSYV
ncbi:MAG: hypothetical protein LUD77_04990 [Clostridiales bacterium]|nr:hypothetical protein [Clostridiales bacterium]